MKDNLLALGTLLGYLLCGLVLVGVNIPIPHPEMIISALFYGDVQPTVITLPPSFLLQLYFVGLFIGAFTSGNLGSYCQQVLYQWDIMIASICHGTKFRSISGIVGQRSAENQLRYKAVEKVINTLFHWEHDHCQRTYHWERSKGLV
ncbi:hypothetical protein [Gayadomonas joobiniege]|uniref:hypothetical protein n=1 Tax=Gayadomonas joobiniege TaxID=1234606 RepID=UPI0012DD03E8|nr:hypothetical protein [Gayadomonas joobiniege]